MYKVIKSFYDLQDLKKDKTYKFYEEGEKYPRQGQKPSDARIEELLGSNNAQGEPLIIEEGSAEKMKNQTKLNPKRK